MTAKLGRDHPETLQSMANLARALAGEGQLDKALELHRENVKLRREQLGPDAPRTFEAVYNLAETEFQMERPQEALSTIGEYVEERKAKPDDPNLFQLHHHVARLLLKHEKFAEAEKHLRDCLSISETDPPAPSLLHSAKSMLGESLAKQEKFEDAERLLIESYEGLKQLEVATPLAARQLLDDTVQRLIDLYTAWEKPEKAVGWQAEQDGHRAGKEASR
jgi:tetratricopeptide (TPR) repeat protein